MANTVELDIKKMYWHSRRGMLELDLILVPFAEVALPLLPPRRQQEYARLLTEEDQDLYQWLVRKVPVPESALQGIVDTVLAFGEDPAGFTAQ